MTDVIVWAIYCDSFLGISVLRWLISAMSLVAAITPAQVTYIVLVDKTIDASVARHYKCYTNPTENCDKCSPFVSCSSAYPLLIDKTIFMKCFLREPSRTCLQQDLSETRNCENNEKESRGKGQWSDHWLKDSGVKRKVEAPGDAYSREKKMGGSCLQIYKKPVVENQGIN